MMEDTMKTIDTVMRTCRDSLGDTDGDNDRSMLILSIVFNVARLAGEEGINYRTVADHVLNGVALGYRDGNARRIARKPAH